MANLSNLNQRIFFGSDISRSHLLEPEDLCYVIKEEISPLIKDKLFSCWQSTASGILTTWL